jgi:hypothetical protein
MDVCAEVKDARVAAVIGDAKGSLKCIAAQGAKHLNQRLMQLGADNQELGIVWDRHEIIRGFGYDMAVEVRALVKAVKESSESPG